MVAASGDPLLDPGAVEAVKMALLPLALPLPALNTDSGRAMLDQLGQRFFSDVLAPENLPHPASPDTVEEAAIRLLTQRAAFGMASHIWAQTMERFTPLKHMGFGQFGAFLADMAGFQRLASSVMQPIEFAAIQQPMRYKAGRLYRSTLPDQRLLELLYSKKEVNPAALDEVMSQQGFAQRWIDVTASAAFLDPRLSEVVRIGQFFQPGIIPELREPPPVVRAWLHDRRDWLSLVEKTPEELGADWWWYYKFMKGGYEMADVEVLVEVAKRATSRRENTLALSAATRLYRDGFVGPATRDALVRWAWAAPLETGDLERIRSLVPNASPEDFENPLAARIMATDLTRSTRELGEGAQLALRAFSRRLLTEAELRDGLADMGIPPERAAVMVLNEKLGLLPRVRVELEGVGAEEDDLGEVLAP
jgi:hypothetical protein